MKEVKKSKLSLEYSDSPSELEILLKDIKISYEIVGKDKFFTEDKKQRLILNVRVQREQKTIDFKFGMSLQETAVNIAQLGYDGYVDNIAEILTITGVDFRKTKFSDILEQKKKLWDNLEYNLLTCMRSDYFIDPIFENFCNDFGYNEDSRKHFRLWQDCLKQSEKIKRIFNEDEINLLPS